MTLLTVFIITKFLENHIRKMWKEQPELALILLTLIMVYSIIVGSYELTLELIYTISIILFDDTYIG